MEPMGKGIYKGIVGICRTALRIGSARSIWCLSFLSKITERVLQALSRVTPVYEGVILGSETSTNMATQRTQYTLIKEDTLNYRGLNIMIQGIFP